MNVRLSKEQKVKILNSKDIFNVMKQVLLRENKIRRNQEHFWIVGLNTKNEILFIELISLGAANRMLVEPGDIYRMAIYKLAQKVIFVHNHPSGDLKISKEDHKATVELKKAGKILKIKVIDHLIISPENYFSFADKGLL